MKTVFKLKISTNNLPSLLSFESLLFSYSPLRKYFKIISVAVPKKTKKFVLLKSPHVNKKAKEHFQISTYKRVFFLVTNFSIASLKKNFRLREILENKIFKLFFHKVPNDIVIVLKKQQTLTS